MSIALIVTRGFGNGTLTGTIKDVVTRGYAIGVAVVVPIQARRVVSVPYVDRTYQISASDRVVAILDDDENVEVRH